MEASSMNQHDVFIDFSAKDTRYSFVSHLSAAFLRRNISIFLGLGEDCSQAATQQAIEGAKVFVVIFSQNYAFSPLSLETLTKFLDLQRRENGPVVIPVFYGDVTPSVVEQQLERFGVAFSEHRSLFSEDDRVERWRNGLVEAAKLQGYESNEQPNDSELVDEIVADVREKLYPTGKIGIYLRLDEIENLICKQSNKVYRLGIWGMPGIGKTTIAQEVFNQMSHDFEAVCFLQDFHVKFHEKGLHILREEHSVEKLRGKTVLVVLDDVRNPMEAESFLGGFDCFGIASLIIITSRDKQVLHQCQVEGVYEVPSLNKKEAQRLFNGLAFPKEKPSDSKLVEVSNKVVEYANGNPTALCFYGRELEGRTKAEEMEVDFEKIKRRCPQRGIIDMFKSSYDVLSDNERSIFLDVACFFNGEELDRIMQIFEGCGFYPHVGIERLVERSLLMISKNRTVEMHNLIRDVAREIVNEENNQILRRRRLWDPSCIRLLLEDTEPKSLAKLKIINLSHSQQLVEVDELSKATSLEKIDLQGCTSLERTPRVDQLKKLQLVNLSSCTRIKRAEIIEQIKGLDLEGVLRETKSGSMVFSTLVNLEAEENTESV
ncbi:hypothetical protein Bca52824_030904 [Brassica carinata]|uniref:TIR domain-containing protein n=1 Tax=Brassica carinata TaxID=52824 RepID=A0A8X7SA11_BRACI|nr:hypothetical protein Bca52824_030904 [Brassica carinata]